MADETPVGTRETRVPTLDPWKLVPVAAATGSIIALGLAEGGYAPTTWWSATFAFVVVGMAGIVVNGRVAFGRDANLVVGASVLLAMWTAVSAAWAPDAALAIVDARRATLYVGVLVALLLVGGRRGRDLANGALVGVGALTTIALGFFLLPLFDRAADSFEGYLLSEPIGYANALGIVAAVGLVLSLMVTDSATLRKRQGAAASVVAFAAALVLSGSRGAGVACIVGLTIAVCLSQDRASIVAAALALLPGAGMAAVLCIGIDVRGPYPRFDEGRSLNLALGLLGVALMSAIAAPALSAALRARPLLARRTAFALVLVAAVLSVGAATRADELTETRLAYWRVALGMAGDHPFWGAGSGSFASAWQASGADRGARDAHGAFTETLAELGVPGLCLLAIVLLVPLAAGVRLRKTSWVAVATGAYGAVVVHAAIDWDRELPVVVVVGSALAVSLLKADTDVLHPADEATAVANLASQVGAVRSAGDA